MSGNAIENMKISVIFEAVEAFFFSDSFSFFFFRYFEIEEIPTMKTEIKKTGRSTLLLGTQTLGKIFLEKMNSIERFFDRCKYFHKNNYFS